MPNIRLETYMKVGTNTQDSSSKQFRDVDCPERAICCHSRKPTLPCSTLSVDILPDARLGSSGTVLRTPAAVGDTTGSSCGAASTSPPAPPPRCATVLLLLPPPPPLPLPPLLPAGCAGEASSSPASRYVAKRLPGMATTSAKLPCAEGRPPSSTTTLSAELQNCSWFVMKSTAFPWRRSSKMHRWKTVAPTCASMAESGSSSTTTSESA
mmetsp:Transcript_98305/g.282671  ORF Transcript_98305/g.282671 Transcript_98305/m.282671 type:complete len:210 (+) Transcript_98305:1912-2541(+)